MITKVYGANIAVKDLDAAVEKYENLLGIKPFKFMGEGDFAFPGLKGAAFDIDGFILHLIASDDPSTSVSKFVESRGEGLFLLSLKSDNVAEDMKRMEASGVRFVLPEPSRGDFGEVNFVHPKSAHGVQLEVYNPKE